MEPSGEITQILEKVNRGDEGALEILSARCLDELRTIARAAKSTHGAPREMQTTMVVHEVFLKLHRKQPSKPWENSAHYFGSARHAASQVILDAHRRRSTRDRGQDELVARRDAAAKDPTTLGAREERARVVRALDELSRGFPRAAQVVVYKLIHGKTDDGIAELLGVSRRTVQNDWRFARAYLRDALDRPPESPESPV
jgi:RNA polymerase sigma factor (TIGR02999 family)